MTEITKKCKYCGEEFKTNRRNRIFCYKKNHSTTYYNKVPLKIPKYCDKCGNIFTPKRAWQKFCSINCQQLSYYFLTKKVIDREKLRARNIANKRTSIKDEICQYCGSTENITRHHYDYSKPLHFDIACAKCHYKLDRQKEEKTR